MASTLPGIHLNGARFSTKLNNPVMTERIPSPPSKCNPAPSKVLRRPREQRVRSQPKQSQPVELSKLETQRYRNSYFHTLCLEVLKGGFHRAFAEVFALVKDQQINIDAAGANSLVQDRTLLADQHAKLDRMKQHLTEAELALRIGDMQGVYSSRLKLANHFLEIGDLWLSDHFFQSCLDSALTITDDDKRVVGEAHCNLGLACERRKQFDDAAAHFEEFYALAKEKQWRTGGDVSLHSEACEHLRRLYTAIADTHRNTDEEIQCLIKTCEMAKESNDKRREGESSYRLGLAYERAGDSEMALQYLIRYMDLCRGYKDQEGLGKACEAIAKCYERQGKLDEVVHYLQMFGELAEKTGQQKAHCRACSCLGSIHNSLGQYSEASQFFGKAYTTARGSNDTGTTEATRVLYGIATAHSSLGPYAHVVEDQQRSAMGKLMEWKDIRTDLGVLEDVTEGD